VELTASAFSAETDDGSTSGGGGGGGGGMVTSAVRTSKKVSTCMARDAVCADYWCHAQARLHVHFADDAEATERTHDAAQHAAVRSQLCVYFVGVIVRID